VLGWISLLAGPLIWALHFSALYFIASVSEQAYGETTFVARVLIVLAGVGAAGALVAILLKRDQSEFDQMPGFARAITRGGAALALFAVILQTLPALSIR
jgi:hypothetical protein